MRVADLGEQCGGRDRADTGLLAQTRAVLIERKITEGKTRREARRAHKRHLANRVIRRMWRDEKHRLSTLDQQAA